MVLTVYVISAWGNMLRNFHFSKSHPLLAPLMREGLVNIINGGKRWKIQLHTFKAYFLHYSLSSLRGVPAVVDFAAMRDAVKKLGGDPEKINPVCPADLVIDHSIQVDFNRRWEIKTNTWVFCFVQSLWIRIFLKCVYVVKEENL